MEDYKSILERSEKELNALKQKEAVVKAKVESLADELKLDKTKPLLPQIENLKTKVESEIAESNEKVASLLEQLKELEDE